MNFMAGGIFCVKSFLLRRHAAAPCRSRHFEQNREISCTQKFPIELKRSGSKPDRKPFAKSFLLT